MAENTNTNIKKLGLITAGAASVWIGAASGAVQAEGSKDLMEQGGYRPFLDWAPGKLWGGVERTTIIYVYAKQGETIHLGSSVPNSYDQKDIVLTSPSGTKRVLDVLSTGKGYINTLAKEKAGPLPASGGYTPLTVTADETGLWQVEFHGPGDPATSDGIGALTARQEFSSATQNHSVAAWDVTVKDAAGIIHEGRAFTKYLAMNMGAYGTAWNSQLYVLTDDGYRYMTDMNGLDPFVFVFFSNNRGYIDKAKNETLYRSVPFTNLGDYSVHNPGAADTATDVTHRIFFNTPSAELPSSIRTAAVAPPAPQQFAFAGLNQSIAAYIGEGGTFRFTSPARSTYQLIIDIDKDNVYNPVSDVVIENVAVQGENVVTWDGKDSSGANVPVGEYKVRLVMKGGEYHFPMLDVENSPNGIKINLQNAPGAFADGTNSSTVYYDDRNYGTVSLDGTGVPNPREALRGIDSSNGAHAFSSSYGDNKVIDTWTYFAEQGKLLTTVLHVVDSKLSGTVYKDDNADGTRNSGETGLAGVAVKVTDSKGIEHTAVTDAAGQYWVNAYSGTAKVEIDTAGSALNGYYLTTGNAVQTVQAIAGSNAAVPTGFSYNHAPSAADVSVQTDEDQPVSGAITGSDIENDPLTFAKASSPAHGSVQVQSDGSWMYTPAPNYAGPDSFQVKVSDGAGGETTATVHITVKPVNDVPVLPDVQDETDEDTPVHGQVTGTDADGNSLTYAKAAEAAHGAAVVQSDGSWTYTPAPGYFGPDSFQVKVSDGAGGETTAPVHITVKPVNDAPVLPDMQAETDEDKLLNSRIAGTDVDGDSLTYAKGSEAAHGTVTVDEDGSWSYEPDQNYTGPDSFTVKVQDGIGGEATARVDVTVKPVNDAPQAPDAAVVTLQDTPAVDRVQGTDIDGDSLSYTIGAAPAHGTVQMQPDGTWEYQPDSHFTGTDAFTVEVSDGRETTEARITVQVRPLYVSIDGGAAQTFKTGIPVLTGEGADTDQTIAIQLLDKNGQEVYSGTAAAPDGTWQLAVAQFLPEGTYTVVATAADSGGQQRRVQQEITIQFPKLELELEASPAKLIGDGKTTTVLTAVLKDEDGHPISNEEVAFTAEMGELSSPTGRTDENGRAQVILRAPNLSGTIVSIEKAVQAVVKDEEKRLFAEDTIQMIFEPAIITGQLIDSATNKPIAGAQLTVAEDFDQDGTVDFTATLYTDQNGNYQLAVPQGNHEYKLHILAAAEVGGLTVPVQFEQTAQVGESSGTKEEIKSDKLVYGQLFVTDPVTKLPEKLSDALGGLAFQPVVLNDETNSVQVDMGPDGSFIVRGGVPGKSYDIALNVQARDEHGVLQELIGQKITVQVQADGVAAVQSVLIDPYGTVKDAETGEAVTGAEVSLYWADTELNRSKGRVPNTIVNLPRLPGFAPNDNADPQLTDHNGAYAWMVFPEGDYYIIAKKPGYDLYDSRVDTREMQDGDSYIRDGIIHVGHTIVNYDFAIKQETQPVNHAPAATDYQHVIKVNETLQGKVTGTDMDGDTLSYGKGTNPLHGAVTVQPDGSYSYAPAPGFTGTDFFTILVQDGKGGAAAAHVEVKVQASPVQAPFERSATVETFVNRAVSGRLADLGIQNSSALQLTQPLHGSVKLDANGVWTYTPTADYVGTDTFLIISKDKENRTTMTTVRVQVYADYRNKVKVSQQAETTVNQPISGTVISVNGAQLSFSIYQQPKHGNATVDENGKWVYTPAYNYAGTDIFQIAVRDERGRVTVATVTVQVQEQKEAVLPVLPKTGSWVDRELLLGAAGAAAAAGGLLRSLGRRKQKKKS